MSFQATAWASSVKTGGPARKAVLMMVAEQMSFHDDEADGFLCGFPGQELIAERAEMSVRSARDHIAELVRRGLLQRKRRYKFVDGSRTSDWYRIPVKSDGTVTTFAVADGSETFAEWPEETAQTIPKSLPANPAGRETKSVDNSGLPANGRSAYRQTVAGDKGEDQGVKPPPTSSTQKVPKIEEEEYSNDLKNFVATLDYCGQTPSRTEYQRIAIRLAPLWGKVDPGDLRRRLQHNAGVGAQSVVAVYVSRLQNMRLDDFRPKTRSVNSSGRAQWCGRGAVCDPVTRRLIDENGYIRAGVSCPDCSITAGAS